MYTYTQYIYIYIYIYIICDVYIPLCLRKSHEYPHWGVCKFRSSFRWITSSLSPTWPLPPSWCSALARTGELTVWCGKPTLCRSLSYKNHEFSTSPGLANHRTKWAIFHSTLLNDWRVKTFQVISAGFQSGTVFSPLQGFAVPSSMKLQRRFAVLFGDHWQDGSGVVYYLKFDSSPGPGWRFMAWGLRGKVSF
jgi:hypothetical protein